MPRPYLADRKAQCIHGQAGIQKPAEVFRRRSRYIYKLRVDVGPGARHPKHSGPRSVARPKQRRHEDLCGDTVSRESAEKSHIDTRVSSIILWFGTFKAKVKRIRNLINTSDI